MGRGPPEKIADLLQWVLFPGCLYSLIIEPFQGPYLKNEQHRIIFLLDDVSDHRAAQADILLIKNHGLSWR